MTTSERRLRLEEWIKEEKELDVNTIKDEFNISIVTVRNDLLYLERNGVIKRQFGKAVYREDTISNVFDNGEIKNLYEKEKIGKYAASLIEDNESVMFYAGTTTLQAAKFLPEDKHFISVTNSIYIAYELKKNPVNTIVIVGGNFNPDTGSTYGNQAINQLDEYTIDKMFLAVSGIDAESGITNDHPFETDVNIAMIKKSKKVIVLADHSKIGVTKFIRMGNIEDIDMLITDGKAPEDQIEKIRSKGIEVVVV